jgi:glyoxylase-like metal-dependent hydrolase (beta-lactamase superfamily II)
MEIHAIDTGYFKLDGGAMFGVVPKTVWNKLYPSDEQNLCTWAMRCLLIVTENKRILIDTGLGDKQSTKFFGYYQPHGDASLLSSIQQKGFNANEITDVVLTHLHFDHCGGAVKWNDDRSGYEATFPKATYWTHPTHLAHALAPNPREKASFLKENIQPLVDAQQFSFINEGIQQLPSMQFRVCNGHTESMLIPIINYKGRQLIYAADLIPSHAHLPVNYVMGYDIRPLETMKERAEILNFALDNKAVLVFEHDALLEACTVRKEEGGRVVVDESLHLSEI